MVRKTSPDPTGYGSVRCEARIQQHCLGDSDAQGGRWEGSAQEKLSSLEREVSLLNCSVSLLCTLCLKVLAYFLC